MPEKLDAGSRDDASRAIVDGGRVDQSSADHADAASPTSNGSSDPMSLPSSSTTTTTITTTMKPADPPPTAAGSHEPAGGTSASSLPSAAGVGEPLAGASGANAGTGGASGSESERLIDVAWRTVADPQVEWLQRWRQAAGGSDSGLSANLVKSVLSTLLVQCAREPRQCIETCTVIESDCGQCAADMECAADFAKTCGLLGAKCTPP